MRILFLDDNEWRHKEFKRNSIGHLVDHSYSAADAIKRMEETSYDRVYLDFDLTDDPEEAMMDDYEEGQVVADWAAAHIDPSDQIHFVIHSLNDTGAASMLRTLRSANLKVVRLKNGWKVTPEEIKV